MSSPQTILAIDPGPERSAWVEMRGMEVVRFGYDGNEAVLESVYVYGYKVVIMEDVKSYGMPVGADVFEMCKWMGKVEEAVANVSGESSYIANAAIRAQICKSMKAKDPHIRQALIDRYGGKDVAIGRKPKNKKDKSRPGPLYGMKQKEHHWSALAVGVAWLELNK